MTRDEMMQLLDSEPEAVTTPIDFAGLEAQSVLKKIGRWYLILKPQELPQYAWKQVAAAAQSVVGGKTVWKLRFRRPTKALLKLARPRRGTGGSTKH